MLTVGDSASDFAAPLVGDEIEPFRFSNRRGSGPVVLAFFPAAFSSTCTAELTTFRDEYETFAALDARIFGISADLPYALRRFRNEHNLPFDLVSDNDGAISEHYGVLNSWQRIGLSRIARRAVFVLDAAGVVRFAWRAETPEQEPDYDAIIEAVESVSSA